MTLRIGRVFEIRNCMGKLIQKAKNIIFVFYSFICLASFIIVFLETPSVVRGEIQNDKLIERISKDYTNKFCNSLAFGLSKESAMNFSYQENNMIFKKKKYWDDLNQDFIANSIAISVVEDCGYLIGLKGEEGINDFEKDYKSMNNSS